MMSTIERDHEHGDQAVVITKGAPEVLLRCCSSLRRGLEVVVLDDTTRANILADVDRLTGDGLRTLSVAYRPLTADEITTVANAPATALERDLIFVGSVGIIDPPRKEAAVAIAEARRAGIRVIMITGDHPRTAARIATELGIVEPGKAALTGHELDSMSAAGFDAAVRDTSVFARVSPANKLRIVTALRDAGNIVAMTGDGVNDAPALKSADIGIAMGKAGTEVSKEAAKMILADDNFATIVQAVREGRGILDNIRKFLRYMLCSNMGEVLTVFLGVIGAGIIGIKGSDGVVVLPLLATQLLWINLITDTGPALAMGLDPPAADLMARKPRRKEERMIDARMWLDVIQVGFVTAAVTLLAMDAYLPGGLIDGSGNIRTARTVGFTTLVFASMFTCLHTRSGIQSAFSGLFANRWLWGAIGLSVALQVAVVNSRVLNLWLGELRKLVERRFYPVAMITLSAPVSAARPKTS